MKQFKTLVIGNPLTHSLSPALHNYIYDELNLNARLTKFSTTNLIDAITYIKTNEIKLAAITLPYKEQILKFLDSKDPLVDEIKSANTVITHKNNLTGYNTDYFGIAYAFRNITIRNKTVLIIGAGGAARSAGSFIKNNNGKLLWLNRNQQKALNIAKDMSGKVITKNDLMKTTPDIIINTTPVGLYPDINKSPLENYAFKSHQVVFEMIYNPVETKLIKDAKKICKTISGIDMFIAQGLKQIELLTNYDLLTNVKLVNNTKKFLLNYI